jgi:hypothetical protein
VLAILVVTADSAGDDVAWLRILLANIGRKSCGCLGDTEETTDFHFFLVARWREFFLVASVNERKFLFTHEHNFIVVVHFGN